MLLLCGALLLMPPCVHPQGAPQQPAEMQRPRRALPLDLLPDNSDEIYRVDTDLVRLDVTVTDAAGRPVRNLRPGDLKLYEDGVERPLAFFNVERRGGVKRPVAVVFALDVSGSITRAEMMRLVDAMSSFMRRLEDRDSVFAVMSFGMQVKVLQKFTNDQQKLERAFDKLAREDYGQSTHAYDAVDDAVRLLVRSAPRTRERRLLKRAVVMITDGFPVGDTVAPETVIERANAAEVSVYTV
ncbi:MAG: VWA domain-containing protein, partial [Acidobacteriota bacterium]|nr:VWA domain-containing protein [Acidobacteriota bacterium]